MTTSSPVEPYVSDRDEAMMLSDGFKSELFAENLWNKDRHGQTWLAKVEFLRRKVYWWKQQPNGGLEPFGRMPLSMYKDLFG